MSAPVTLLHTGDEHVDSDVHSTVNPATGRPTAWESNAAVVRHLAERAVEEKVDAFISAGDELKTGRPTQEALMMLADALTPLAEARIPVLLLDGNHNRIGVTAGHRSAIWVLSEILRARGGIAVTSATPGLVDIGPVQVATLPWLNKAAVPGASEMSPEDGDRHTAEYAMAELTAMAERADSSRPLIMAGHVTVASQSVLTRGSELELTHLFREPILDVARLEELPFAYGALGHIHTPQTIGQGRYRYAGSPNRLTFTDEHDVKGGNLVTLGADVQVERVRTPARDMLTLDLADDVDTSLIPEGALLRVILADGEMEPDRAFRRPVHQAGASVVAVKARAVARPSVERPQIARSTRPEDALRAFARARDIDDVDALITAAAELSGGAR